MAENNKIGFMFTWKIKNFSLCPQREEEYLKSPLFKIEMLGNSEWELRLYPRKSNEICLQLCRVRNEYGPQKVTCNLEFFLLKKNCSHLCTEKNNLVFQPGYTLTKPWSLPVDKIFNEKELFLPKDTLIVQCRLWNTDTKTFVKCFAVSQISMEKYQISLPLCYFSEIVFLPESEIVVNSVSKKYPNFKIYWAKQYESVDFEVHAIEPTFRVYVRCEILFQKLNCSKIMLFEGDYWFETGTANKKWTMSDIFQSVISDMKRSGNKSYKMDINLFASDASEHSFVESVAYCSVIYEKKEIIQQYPEYLLPKQFEKSYLEEKYSDFTIKSDKKEFKIHKSIFGAVSPVFSAMFDLNMTEKKDSTVKIDDIDSDILEQMVQYVYTGKILHLEWDDALKLYEAADKYQIMDLKELCARILISKMDIENVTDALIAADYHQDKTLMDAAKLLIKEKASPVFRSDKWGSLMKSNPEIACAVMHEIWVKTTESS